VVLALLAAHHIFHISRINVKSYMDVYRALKFVFTIYYYKEFKARLMRWVGRVDTKETHPDLYLINLKQVALEIEA
jgi:hypothetical protein